MTTDPRWLPVRAGREPTLRAGKEPAGLVLQMTGEAVGGVVPAFQVKGSQCPGPVRLL